MDQLLDLLRKRRSTRKFMDTQISPELVEQLMEAALMSPASKSSNPWQFILVDDKEVLKALSVSKKNGAKLLENAALAVVVIADPEVSDVWVEDASIASAFLQLEAEDLGLGSCWVQIRCRQNEEGQDSETVVRGLLDIPEKFRVESIIAIGVKAQEKEPFNSANLQWEKVHVGTFKAHQ
jgi:nitroreductase